MKRSLAYIVYAIMTVATTLLLLQLWKTKTADIYCVYSEALEDSEDDK